MTAPLALRTWRFVIALLLVTAASAAAQQRATSPQEHFGFNMGDDYRLATYTQLEAYWKKLDAESDRVKVMSIGKTAEGRDQLMAIITSPANHARLDEYRGIAARLARAEGLTDAQARALAQQGKAVVWIDGGLHATEVLGATQLIEHVWQMTSRTDPETMRILDDVHPTGGARQPRRHGTGLELVHAQPGRDRALLRRTAPAVPEVRGARQQPRLLPQRDARVREHQPGDVPRVVPADHVQSPPDRSRRHGDVRPAVPGPAQLQPRPAADQPALPGGHRDAHPLRRREQARRDHARRGQLPDLVERWPADRRLLPQHRGHPDGDHRQPDADLDSPGARTGS